MDTKFYHSLIDGDFGNGFHLCQSLVEGDFWARTQGSFQLYRGAGYIDGIDYNRIVATRSTKELLTVPGHLSHAPNSNYFYAVRCASATGKEELGTMAVIRLSLDEQGSRLLARPNQVRALRAEAIADGCIRVSWWYWPLAQQKPPSHFAIFGDNGSGTIDYNESLSEVTYDGGCFYSYISAAGQDGQTYRFGVRSVAEDGTDDNSQMFVSAVVDLTGPAGIEGVRGAYGL